MDNAQWLKGYQKFNKSKYDKKLNFIAKLLCLDMLESN